MSKQVGSDIVENASNDDSSSSSSSSSSLSSSTFTVRAPGRLCLFGEHQDYLNFPVIACAIPLYCQIHVSQELVTREYDSTINSDNTHEANNTIIHLHVPPELGQSKIYDFDQLPPSPPVDDSDDLPDFALAAIYEVLKEGWTFCRNQDIIRHVHCQSSNGELPLQAGCSSSTSFIVAWILTLSKIAIPSQHLQFEENPLYLAQLAHRAEVIHFNHPGGTMDHVAIAFGTTSNCSALRIGPNPWHIEQLPQISSSLSNNNNSNSVDNGIWVLADSGQPKDTIKHLKRCKHDRIQLLNDKLHGNWDYEQDQELADVEQQLWKTTITNRDTEESAYQLWINCISSSSNENSNCSVGHSLALLMKQHHEALRDGLGLSTPRLEAMNDAALQAGAWAFKVVGSGGGGCGCAWTPTDKADAVSIAMKEAGGKATWVIDSTEPVRGAHIF